MPYAVALTLLLGACVSEPEIPTGLGDPVPAAEGVCGLLATADIEVALNRPIRGGLSQVPDRAQSQTDRQGAPAPPQTTGPTPSPPGAGSQGAALSGPSGPTASPLGSDGRDVPTPPRRTGSTPTLAVGGQSARPPPQAQGSRAGGSVRPLLPGMEMCAAGTAEAGATWGLIQEPQGQATLKDLFRDYADWHAPFLEPAEVAGHEALWDPHRNTVVVLTDGAIVGIRLLMPEEGEDDGETEGAPGGQEDDRDGRTGDDRGTADERTVGGEPAGTPSPAPQTSALPLRRRALDLAAKALRRL